MDDRTFDRETALDWIRTIEVPQGGRERDIYPRLKSWIQTESLSDYLEIGCGQGVCSSYLQLQEEQHYTGVDPSSFLVDRAGLLYNSKNRRFLLGNAYGLPFENHRFDGVFSVAVWHLLSDLNQAAIELGRVLKDDGHFLIITANPAAYSLWRGLYTSYRQEGKRLEGQIERPGEPPSQDILHLHSLEEILGSFKLAQLKVLKTETFRASEKSGGQGFLISIQGQKLKGP